MADETLKITTNGEKPKNLLPSLPKAQVKAEHADRRTESKLISGAGSSVSARDGDIELSSNNDTHVMLSKNSTILETSMQHKIQTNRLDIVTDELNLNHHILNPRLQELTDFKEVTTNDFQTGLVGNLCMLGTVLVKAWEPDLNRYVFIRRLARLPVFSPAIAPVQVKSGMGISDPTQAVVNIVGVMDQAQTNNETASGQISAAEQAASAAEDKTKDSATQTAETTKAQEEAKAKEQVDNAQAGKAGAS